MTRINFGIPVKNLTDEHLLAEHREIKRLPSAYLTAVGSGSINRIPKEFRLGKGHVLYFLDKPDYTLHRYKQIHRECRRRGFDVQSYEDNWRCYHRLHGSARATKASRSMVIDRITERITQSSKKFFHYYGKRINKATAIKLLLEL